VRRPDQQHRGAGDRHAGAIDQQVAALSAAARLRGSVDSFLVEVAASGEFSKSG
jgi:hypothetical protein